MLQRTRHHRQRIKTDRCRTACQGVRQSYRAITDGSITLNHPLTHFRNQSARPLVGLVEENVVKRNTYAQAANPANLLILLAVFIQRRLGHIADRGNVHRHLSDGRIRHVQLSRRSGVNRFNHLDGLGYIRSWHLCRNKRKSNRLRLEMQVEICGRQLNHFRRCKAIGESIWLARHLQIRHHPTFKAGFSQFEQALCVYFVGDGNILRARRLPSQTGIHNKINLKVRAKGRLDRKHSLPAVLVRCIQLVYRHVERIGCTGFFKRARQDRQTVSNSHAQGTIAPFGTHRLCADGET